ncbi:MAG: PocR ligand-binding domain-containing protein [Sulfuritalea sp.]|nr:PocR ligand-binding domain-containing protein [Sulfuritalea sp.]
MNPLAKFVVERATLAWALAIALSLLFGVIASDKIRDLREQERMSLLQTDAERRSLELMSITLNGNLMGAIAVLGLIDDAVKQEALGKLPANNPKVFPVLESIGRSYDADGVFVVAESGIIASSWDNAGKPSTKLNVKFRPYYQMAMQGMDNVYAAVSLARGDRSLYFSAPIYSETTSGTEAIGAVVARNSAMKLDHLLRDRNDVALLLSPQGVVYASNRAEWIGHLAGKPTPERLKAIRDLKQFGNMFENKEPALLPLEVTPGRHPFDGRRFAVATAKVQWNDPFGEWTLVLAEDLGRSVPLAQRFWIGAGIALALLLIGMLVLGMLRGQYRQTIVSRQLELNARKQEENARRESGIAAATVHLQRASTLADLSRAFLEEAHAMFGALQGAVYVCDESHPEQLNLAGSYACGEPLPATIVRGEGLLGQCAVERRSQLLPTAQDGFATIRSGLGEARPAAVWLAPVLMNENLLSVVELALLRVPNEAECKAFDDLVGLLAMNIEIVGRSVHTEKLLSATRAAEQANARQLAFQNALLETIPYPVFYKGIDTRFLGVNRAYEKCFGIDRADLIGKNVLDLDYLPLADRVAYQTEDEATIAGIGKVEREMKMPFVDGRIHDTLYFVSGFADAEGRPAGLIGTFIDISDMKQAQDELVRLSDAERFNHLAKGREARVLDLKREINDLCVRFGEAPRYASADMADSRVAEHEAADIIDESGTRLVRLNWHPSYESGNAEIDRDHRALFAVANDLLNAIVAGKSSVEMDRIIGILVQEVTAHFAREEGIQATLGYAHAEEHARIHRELVDKAVGLIGEFKAGRVGVGPFFQFLAYDVVARHMLVEDRKFFPLFDHGDARKARAQPAMQDNKTVPKLAELVDLEELQKLFSAFCESVGIAAAIIDLDAKVLASSRWQRACTDFHRVNPDSCARCIESDTELALKLQDGTDYTMYRCKNGMTDCASPIIIEGHHLANVFIGQFHLGPPDLEFFRQQARQFGYDEAEYLKAVQEAPVADEKRLPVILGFLSGFARMISSMSLARLRADAAHASLRQQAETLQQERIAAMSLAEDAEQARIALEAIAKEQTP